MNHESAIAAGDVIRNNWPARDAAHLALYQGSGRSGALWNAWGLMGPLLEGDPELGRAEVNTWMHADHWHRGNFGLDAWLQVGRLVWYGPRPSIPVEYQQRLTLLDGRLTTRASGPSGRYTLTSYFDPGHPNVLAIELEYDFNEPFPALLFEPALEQRPSYHGLLQGSVRSIDHQETPPRGMIEIAIGTARTTVGLRVADLEGRSRLVADARGWKISFEQNRGRHVLWLGAAAFSRREALGLLLNNAAPESWSAEAATHWKKRWGQAWIELPSPSWQALWARSHFQILSSYGPEVRCPAPPAGWSGRMWPYTFPQDLSYIHPALLRLGHLDIARAWVEFFARTLPSMEEATRRIYGAEGAMWAWEYPIGETSQILPDKGPNQAPNLYQYEIHNAAYPARMAHETALHLLDSAWTRDTAWPVVRASARFYASTLRQAADGLWDLRVEPSMGQDELDEGAGRNYLCSLFSARYCLETATRMAGQLGITDAEVARWRNILADGLAFPRLLGPDSPIYATREGVTASQCAGRQKHPVQLNPLIFLPLMPADAPTREAYLRRRQLCLGAGTGGYQGWTLPAFALAACHSGDGDGMQAELDEMVATRNIDADFIQIYESALARNQYYFTSGGLYLQAVQDALVSDYSGENLFGSAIPSAWGDLAFSGLRTADGLVWEGTRRDGTWKFSHRDI